MHKPRSSSSTQIVSTEATGNSGVVPPRKLNSQLPSKDRSRLSSHVQALGVELVYFKAAMNFNIQQLYGNHANDNLQRKLPTHHTVRCTYPWQVDVAVNIKKVPQRCPTGRYSPRAAITSHCDDTAWRHPHHNPKAEPQSRWVEGCVPKSK